MCQNMIILVYFLQLQGDDDIMCTLKILLMTFQLLVDVCLAKYV